MERSIPADRGTRADDWEFVQAPALQDMTMDSEGTSIQAQSSDIAASETIQESAGRSAP